MASGTCFSIAINVKITFTNFPRRTQTAKKTKLGSGFHNFPDNAGLAHRPSDHQNIESLGKNNRLTQYARSCFVSTY